MLVLTQITLRSQLLINRFNKLKFPFNQKPFEDTKGITRIRKSKKDRHHNGQKKKDKKTNDLQTITHKTTSNTNPTKSEDELGCSGKVSSSCCNSGTRCVMNQIQYAFFLSYI